VAVIQLLGKQHNRNGFDCGDAALNEFLLRQAGQQQRRGFGKTYVALAEDGATVIGFVTATPITAAAFVAWGPILLALAIRSQSTFALEKDRHPPEQVGCLTTRSPTLVSGSAPIIGCEASAGQAAPPRGLQGGDCLVTAMGPARRKQGAQREDTTP